MVCHWIKSFWVMTLFDSNVSIFPVDGGESLTWLNHFQHADHLLGNVLQDVGAKPKRGKPLKIVGSIAIACFRSRSWREFISLIPKNRRGTWQNWRITHFQSLVHQFMAVTT